MTESEAQRAILLDCPQYGARLLRNNSGAFEDKTGRWVHYGLGNSGGKASGSSDLIGPTTITVTPEMVGRKLAIFTAVEVKGDGGKASEAQAAFLAFVQSVGGIACLAYTTEDFQRAVHAFISGTPSAIHDRRMAVRAPRQRNSDSSGQLPVGDTSGGLDPGAGGSE